MQIQKLFRCVHRNLTGLKFTTIPVSILRNFDKELDPSKKNDYQINQQISSSNGNGNHNLSAQNILNSSNYANGDMIKEFDVKRQQLLKQQENSYLLKGVEKPDIEEDLEAIQSSSNDRMAEKKTDMEDEIMDTLEEAFILELEDDEFDSINNKEDDELIGLNNNAKEGIVSYKASHNINLLQNSHHVITSSEENTGSYRNIKQIQLAHQRSWNKAGRRPVSFQIQENQATKQHPSSDEIDIDGIDSSNNNESAKEGLDPKSAEEIRRDIVELLRSSSISLTEKVSYLKLAVNEQTLVPTLSQFIIDFYDKSIQELHKLEQDTLLDAIYVYSLTLSCLPYPASTLLQQQFLQKIQQLPLVSFLDAKKVLYLLNKHHIFNKSIIVASFSIFKHTMLLNTFSIEDRLEFFEYFVNNQKGIHSSKNDMCTSNQLKIIYLQGGLTDLLSNFQAACRFDQSFSLRLLHAISLLRFDIQSIRETQRKCIDIQALPNLSNAQLLFLMQIIYSSNFHFPEILSAIFSLFVKRLPTILDKKTNPEYMYQFMQFYRQIGTEIFPEVSEEQYLELKTIYNVHLSQIIELQTLPYSILMAFLFVQASSPFFKDTKILNLIMQAIEKKRKKNGFKSDLVCLPFTVAFFQIKNPELWGFLISSFDCRKVRDPSHFSQFALGFNYCLNNVEELKDSQELKTAIASISQKIRIFQRQKQNMNFSTALVEFQKHFKINCFVIQGILKKLSVKARFFDTIEGCLYNTIVISDWRSLVAAAESADESELVEDINQRFSSKVLIQLNQNNQFYFDKTKDLVVLMDKPRFFNKQGLIEYNLQFLTSRGYNVISIGQEIGDWCDPCDFESTMKFTISILQKFKSISFQNPGSTENFDRS